MNHYDPEEKQQSVEWRYSSSPRPKKNLSVKIRWKSPRTDFLGSLLLIDYLPKGQTINADCYSSLLVQLKEILKEKRPGSSPRASCSCTTMPQLTGHLHPRRNWPTWALNVLITHIILWIWSRWTTTCYLE